MICCHCFASFFGDLYEVYMIDITIYHNYIVTVRDVEAAAFKSEPQLVGKYLRSPRVDVDMSTAAKMTMLVSVKL